MSSSILEDSVLKTLISDYFKNKKFLLLCNFAQIASFSSEGSTEHIYIYILKKKIE